MEINPGRSLPPPPPWHRQLTSVGVTGTNGKTTTATYVAAALSQPDAPAARITTVGCFVGSEQVGPPGGYREFLQTLKTGLDRGGRHAVLELSSEALARGFATAWPCRVGVFTNLTRDHLDAHASAEHYLASKAQLFVHLPPDGAAVLNGCDPAAALLAEVVPAGVRILHYGVASRGEPAVELDLRATSVELGWAGTRIELAASADFGEAPSVIQIRAIGEVFVENALAALAAAVATGAAVTAAAAAIQDAAAPPGRFEVVAERPHVVIDYAHTPDALERTLLAARRLCAGRLTVVFGAGGERDRNKRPMMGQAARIADRVILTNDNPRHEDPTKIAEAIRLGLSDHPDVQTILDRSNAIQSAIEGSHEPDVVLIAGKGHETEQQVGDDKRWYSDHQVVEQIVGARSD